MDLELYLRVLWRFKLLIAAGFLVAAGLAFLSVVRVSPGGSPALSYREDEVWVGRAMLLLTEQGFPVGRASFETEEEGMNAGRTGELSPIYARLATSDAVRSLVLAEGPIDDTTEYIEVTPVLANPWNSNSAPLPILQINSYATTPERAKELTKREIHAFQQYLASEQDANKIPRETRVLVTEMQTALPPELLTARSKTLPVVVFMTIMLGFIGLAFLCENLRPRVRVAAEEGSVAPVADLARRSA